MAKCSYCEKETFMSCYCHDKPICPDHAKKGPIGYLCLDHARNHNVKSGAKIMMKSHAKGKMRYGLFWIMAGLGLTLFSLLWFDRSYILWWGPMIYGAILFVQGLLDFWR